MEKKSNADLQWKYGRNIYGESIRDVIHIVIAVIVDMKQPKTLITAPNVAIVFKSVFWEKEAKSLSWRYCIRKSELLRKLDDQDTKGSDIERLYLGTSNAILIFKFFDKTE